MIGDLRWTGIFGVNVDVVARTHCSVELIKTEDVLVIPTPPNICADKLNLILTTAGDHGKVRIFSYQVQNATCD